MAKITFNMPKGDSEWDELEPGEKMSVSASVRKEEGGMACLVSVDGKTLEGYSDSEEDEEVEEEEMVEPSMMEALDEQM